jgi:hypothetical protein
MTPCFNTDRALWENYREQYPDKPLVIHDNGGVSQGRECLAFFIDQDQAKKTFRKAGYKVRKAKGDFGNFTYLATAA